MGGANSNRLGIGDQPGGVKLGVGDLAVSQEGYVVFRQDGELAVGWPSDGSVQKLPVEKPTRLSFADGRPVLYVHSSADDELHAVDVQKASVLWSAPLTIPDVATDDEQEESEIRVDAELDTRRLSLASTPDDSRVMAAWDDKLVLFETDAGKRIVTRSYDRDIVDARILSGSERALVVHSEEWSEPEEDDEEATPSTTISIVQLDRGERRTFTVPNCSARVAIDEQSSYAFLAPTTCQRDPISVLSLAPGEESFVRNLPGFGPVRIAPQGTKAIGFLEAGNVDESLFEETSQIPPEPTSEKDDAPEYYLMVIDTETLSFELHAYGDSLPRYAMTPNGQVLLVDQPLGPREQNIHYFEVETGNMREFDGPRVELDHYVMTEDSTHSYALYHGLFEVDISVAEIRSMEVGFTPENLNMGPEDRTLFLRKPDDTVCIYSIPDAECTGQFQSSRSEKEVDWES